ncbi:MAG: adenylyl-sulfate kinase [Bacteroidota bacterium]
MADNIHPIFDNILDREAKEKLLNQDAMVIWMTGLSGSGKSTIAKGLELKLYEHGVHTKLLDGDNLRTGLNNNLGFSDEDRIENIRRVAETARLFLDNGIVTICSFVSPTISIRKMAADIIGHDDFMEVMVEASFDECARRDVKGLYKKALRGEIKDFTGLDAPFEVPEDSFLSIDTEKLNIEESVDLLFKSVINKIKNNAKDV